MRRPASQPSKLITPLGDQVFSDSQVIVFRQSRKPAHFTILEVLLDERLERDPKILAFKRYLRELCPRLANRIGSKLIDEPRLPADSLLEIFQALFQCREYFCTRLKQLRVLGAIPGARTENKNQGDKAQYDAEGCFCSSPEKASLKKKESRAKLHTV